MAEDQPESANSLRDKLSAANQAATDGLARALIAEEGLDQVKVEDFKGLPWDQVEEKARTLQQERSEAAEAALRTALESRGITDIDAALAQLQGGGEEDSPPTNESLDRIRRVGSLGGTPQTGQIDTEAIKDDGDALMRAYFQAQE